jgi:hypothetical protein
VDAVKANVEAAQKENPSTPRSVDLVTTSASGLDPHMSPAGVDFQVPRVARERGTSEADVRRLVAANTEGRTFGFFGEPRVNLLELNLALDAQYPVEKPPSKRLWKRPAQPGSSPRRGRSYATLICCSPSGRPIPNYARRPPSSSTRG